jgi:hypothetical protein
VTKERLELSRPHGHQLLRLAWLPLHHSALFVILIGFEPILDEV